MEEEEEEEGTQIQEEDCTRPDPASIIYCPALPAPASDSLP